LDINVPEIDEMNSQVDSNGDDCLDYQQLAGNINQNELSLGDKMFSGHSQKSLGSALSGKKYLKS
jgi:hypothetical protein